MSELLALFSSLGWGLTDFLGGLRSRERPVLNVLVGTQSLALLIGIAFVLISGEGWPRTLVFLSATAAGICGVSGLGVLFTAMRDHKMGVIAPISGLGVLLPVVFGLSRGESPGVLALLGAAIAIAGVFFSVYVPGSGTGSLRERRALLLAFASAFFFGCAFSLGGYAAQHNPAWDVCAGALGALSLSLVVTVIKRQRWQLRRSDTKVFIAIGVVDTLAVATYAYAANLGEKISLSAVLASLGPAVITVLAAVFLHERLSRRQVIGVVLVLAGIVVISSAS
jgi:drug/metabolite transporter (DMT)-like permease